MSTPATRLLAMARTSSANPFRVAAPIAVDEGFIAQMVDDGSATSRAPPVLGEAPSVSGLMHPTLNQARGVGAHEIPQV